jgi:hypothetical protein
MGVISEVVESTMFATRSRLGPQRPAILVAFFDGDGNGLQFYRELT